MIKTADLPVAAIEGAALPAEPPFGATAAEVDEVVEEAAEEALEGGNAGGGGVGFAVPREDWSLPVLLLGGGGPSGGGAASG